VVACSPWLWRASVSSDRSVERSRCARWSDRPKHPAPEDTGIRLVVRPSPSIGFGKVPEGRPVTASLPLGHLRRRRGVPYPGKTPARSLHSTAAQGWEPALARGGVAGGRPRPGSSTRSQTEITLNPDSNSVPGRHRLAVAAAGAGVVNGARPAPPAHGSRAEIRGRAPKERAARTWNEGTRDQTCQLVA